MTVHKIKITCNLCQKSWTRKYDDERDWFFTDDESAGTVTYYAHYMDEHQKGETGKGSFTVEGVA